MMSFEGEMKKVEEVAVAVRRFAVLKTGEASEYTERTYGCYGKMMEKLFKDADDECWDIFPVLDGNFSFLDQYHVYDAFVITGSAADAHAKNIDWIHRLCHALIFLHSQQKRLLGICFGHQILARALGGETGRAALGWELGLKRIRLDSSSIRHLYGFNINSTLHVIESHRDQVTLVPPGAMILAASEKTEIEMFALGQHVLGMQWHPEFSKDVILDIIHTRLSRQISTAVANEAIKSLEERQADQEPVKQLCKIFLKGHSHMQKAQ